VTGLELAAGGAVLAGALLQSAVGFGFALICAPLLFAAFGPAPAVGLVSLLALAVNGISLAGEGRRPQPLARLAAIVTIWSVPGMLAGVAVLRNADPKVLQVALTVVVLGTLALRRWSGGDRPAPPWAAPAAGLSSGILTTTLTTGGPPLVLLMIGRGHTPIRVRDTLTALFIVQGLLAIGALAVTRTDAAVPPAAAVAALVPLAVAGQIGGRPLFARLAEAGDYERVLTVVLVISAAVGLTAALA
jgi:uncharacterized protein